MSEEVLQIDGIDGLTPIVSSGNSTVYCGRQPSMDRSVAVKVLNQSGEAVDRRFERELKALGRLSRLPGVVTVYETGFTVDGHPYLVMPWIDGGSLQQRLDETGPLPWVEAADLVAKAAETLATAHSAGVVHSDIKPANLLLGDDGSVLITDFGIAQLNDYAHTRTSSVAMTPQYAAPELVFGEKPTPATDIYGLGATLYALVHGHPPYDNVRDLVALANAITLGEIPELDGSVPPALTAVYARCMAKAPADRYRSATEVAIGLRGGADVSSVSRVSHAAGHRTLRPWLMAGLASLLGLLVLGAGSVLTFGDRDRPDAARTPASEAAVSEVSTTLAATTSVATTTTSPPTTTTTTLQRSVADLFLQAQRLEVPFRGSIHEPATFADLVWVVRTEDDGSGTLIRLDSSTGAVVDATPVGATSTKPVFANGLVWLYSTQHGTLSGYDTTTMEEVASLQLTPGQDPIESVTGRYPDQPVVAPDGSIWVATNTRADIFARVLRVDPVSQTVESKQTKLIFTEPPIIVGTSVFIPGLALCYRHGSSWGDETWARLDMPVHGACKVVTRIDAESQDPTNPDLVTRNTRYEYIDPDGLASYVRCPESGPRSQCFKDTDSARLLYEWTADWAIPTETSSADGSALWISSEAGVVDWSVEGTRRRATICWTDAGYPDLWTERGTVVVAGQALWITRPVRYLSNGPPGHDSVCAVDLSVATVHDGLCINQGADVQQIACEPSVFGTEPPRVAPHPALEVGPLLAAVPSGYGSSVWLPMRDGTLLLLDLTERGIERLAEFEIGPGVGLPHVADDGTVWVGAKGRLVRLRPAIGPSEFDQPGVER